MPQRHRAISCRTYPERGRNTRSHKTIPADETETAESVGKTLESYVAMLEDWDHECTLSDANEQDEHEEEPPERTKNSKGQKQGDRDNEYDNNDRCDEPVHRHLKIDPGLFLLK